MNCSKFASAKDKCVLKVVDTQILRVFKKCGTQVLWVFRMCGFLKFVGRLVLLTLTICG